MGRDSVAACIDCKVVYQLGYGSASTWLDFCKTVAEYDAQPAGQALSKNKAWRAFLVEHETHKWESWSSDWCSSAYRDGRSLVVYDHGDEEVVADITGFRRIDCDKEDV